MTRTDVGPTGATQAQTAKRRPSTRAGTIREHLLLERPISRFLLAAALVIASFGSPYVTVAAGLPAVRFEQVLLLLAAIPVLRLMARHAEMRRLAIVDLGFLILGLSTLATLALAPAIVPGVDRNVRDVFEIARIAQYWLVFRLGLILVPADAASWRVARVLAAGSIVLGVLAVIQYLNPTQFNETITAIWTQAHNLLGVTREGRAVGTAGNANQFAILAVMLLFVAFAGRVADDVGGRRWIWALGITAAAVGVVLAQSRGAILGLVVGSAAAALLILARRQFGRTLRLAVPPLLLAAAILVPLIVIAPPSSGSIARRLSFAGLSVDPSIVVRIGRIDALVNGGSSNADGVPPAEQCEAGPPRPARPAPGHEPGTDPPAPASRTATTQIASAVFRFACLHGEWPAELARDLVPVFLPSIPPAAADLRIYSSDRGYAIGTEATLAQRTEAQGVASFPNLLANPSFEGRGGPSPWRVTAESVISLTIERSAFGPNAAAASLQPGGAAYQLIVADLPPETAYTAGLWVRTSNGESANLQLYVTAVTARGDSIDPLAVRTFRSVDGSSWQHLSITFNTPASRLTALQLMVRASDGPAHVLLDGASLTEGPFPIPFGSLSDAPASSASIGPSFADSPILGVGPQKDEGVAVYDNEYASFLAHYGILGLIAYCLLFVTTLLVGLRAALRVSGSVGVLGVALVATTLALGVFAIPAGAFHQLQVMLVYWLLVGMVAAATASAGGSSNMPDSGRS